MKINYNQFLAVVYSDIFGWPLTRVEARVWAIKDKSFETKGKTIEMDGKYVFLPGREKLVKQRLAREKVSERKRIIAGVVAGFLAKIPTVEAIFLTGSVAVGSAKKDGDIDLMIITAPNSLWLTRMVVVTLLRCLGNYGNGSDRICPNIFLDTNHLGIKERNLYTAHEVLQVECLFDMGGVEAMWVKKNIWTAKYLSNAYAYYVSRIKHHAHRKKSFPEYIIHNTLYMFPELVAFILQYLYQKPKQTNEKLGRGYAFFHPKNLSERVVGEFNKRLGVSS